MKSEDGTGARAVFEGPDAVSGVAPRHSSAHVEYGTPQHVVDAACAVMGGIWLDPASSTALNERVRAGRIYTAEDDGYVRPWHARSVLLNPPGGLSDDQQRPVKPKCRETGSCGLPPGHVHNGVQSGQKKWWNKLVKEYADRRVQQAVFVCFSVELLQSTQSDPRSMVLPQEFSVCYPRQRLKFWRDGAERDQPPHASCVVYLPPLPPEIGGFGWDYTTHKVADFARAFSAIGHVVVPTTGTS